MVQHKNERSAIFLFPSSFLVFLSSSPSLRYSFCSSSALFAISYKKKELKNAYWRQRISGCHRRGWVRAVQRCLLTNCLARSEGILADLGDFVNPQLFWCIYVLVCVCPPSLFSSSSFPFFFPLPHLLFFVSLSQILRSFFLCSFCHLFRFLSKLFKTKQNKY